MRQKDSSGGHLPTQVKKSDLRHSTTRHLTHQPMDLAYVEFRVPGGFMAIDDREAGRAGDDEDEDDDDDFDPHASPMQNAQPDGTSNVAEVAAATGTTIDEEACVVDDLGFAEEYYNGAFVELGSDHEHEEEDDDDEEDEDEDDAGEVDDGRNAVPDEAQNAEVEVEDIRGESPEEDELMGNALEALPELHSPGKYDVQDTQEANNFEDEETVMDAISKRTRAHYSLADMTLDQLETFLQESDEDDYFHNVDDEEEYRKFLSAVTQTAQGEEQDAAAKDDEEDDDEEDDDDFELEIEEALESENEETFKVDEKPANGTRRPETRELRRERMSRPLGLGRTPLRPLVPYHGSGSVQEVYMGKVMLDAAYREGALTYGTCFTAQQVGQLHSLMHEHVQLLVQVFTLCIMDPSRQQIAMSTHGLLTQLVSKLDLPAIRTQAFPGICFQPPHIRASVSEEPFGAGNPWCPKVNQPVYSVVKVAPLTVVKDYLEDIAAVVQEYKQRPVQPGASNRFERRPLFEVPDAPERSSPEKNRYGSSAKKSMAAILVENTKKQTIALVPMGIATACSRFVPFFNPAFFPHKPPAAATANRLLFTDAEDELLAMGLMTFNNDWKAIKERFLPTKSTHQIFVRQKNRASSRAPENPIKTVRRMKTAPLTLEEKENIQEAVKVFKYDWSKVWQHAVPHRDPALLPRQWRTAMGTQKSYKSDDAAKEKRRLHDAEKRRMKERGEASNSDADQEDNFEPRVHQAFLSPATNVNRRHVQQPSAMAGQRIMPKNKTIRLAPGLPSLNLPAHVRVMSLPNGITKRKKPSEQLHPLLLRPSSSEQTTIGSKSPSAREQPAKKAFVSNPQNSAFHPFFGKPSETLRPSEFGTSSSLPVLKPPSKFHPLLQQQCKGTSHSREGPWNQAGYKRQRVSTVLQIGPSTDDSNASITDDMVPREDPVRPSQTVAESEVRPRYEPEARPRDEPETRSRDEPETSVKFECEEMGDSDKEKEIEFEEEEIGSDSENER